MDITQIIAVNLKKLRLERNLSLGGLAKLSGVSKMMLSQIEKGETNPTVNTIWKIAAGLKLPYTALLEEPKSTTLPVRKKETRKQDGGTYRLYCYYGGTRERNFELFQMELDAGCRHASVGHSEKSEEYVMVLEGQLTLTAGGIRHILLADDAVCFDASGEHVYEAGEEQPLRAVVINYYPV